MNKTSDTENNYESWDIKQWLWVLLCTIIIFATVPIARGIQKFVYASIGKDFFTNIVLFIIICVSAILLYFFIFRFKIKKISQYIWILACSGLYIYFTIKLRNYPEEAIHLLEYGLLSYFAFKALSRKVRDVSIYFTVTLFVLFIGTLDELIQWALPTRYWDYNDVRINMLGGGIFQLALWKGIRPEIINRPLQKISVKIFTGMLTVVLLFLGLCLSNTPHAVKRYTAIFNGLSWLCAEEPMTEFGHEHRDPEIGVLESRMTIEEIRTTDVYRGEYFGNIVRHQTDLNESRNQCTDPFLQEFLIHIKRRDHFYDEYKTEYAPRKKIGAGKVALFENLLLEKYFTNTLKISGLKWTDDKIEELKVSEYSLEGSYRSEIGKMITAFSLTEVWILIILSILTVRMLGRKWT